MRSYPFASAVAVAAAAVVIAGCSSGSDEAQSPSSSQTQVPGSAATTTTTTPTHTAAPGAVGVSPQGVTTAVGAPAESTEEEYFQACQAAKTWMTDKGGDLKSQFEPYLHDLQSSNTAGPGTFGTPWAELTAGRQAAIIVAAEAAADNLCG